jgi:hypothetical protein
MPLVRAPAEVTALRRLLPRRVGGRDSPSPLGTWTFPGLGRRGGRVAGPPDRPAPATDPR